MPSLHDTLCQDSTLYAAWNHIRAKSASGGIDGVSIKAFHEARRTEIPRLAKELQQGTWKPQPYMEIGVAKAKHPDEMRRLGMPPPRDAERTATDCGGVEKISRKTDIARVL